MKSVSLRSISGVTACVALVLSSGAYAGGGTENFDLTFSGSGFSGALDLTGASIGNGEYDITSASGTINGASASLLSTAGLPVCTSAICGSTYSPSTNGNTNYFEGTFLFDNVVYTGTSTSLNGGLPLDPPGLAFATAGNNINIYGQGSGFFYVDDLTKTTVPINVSLVAAVPEPSTYLMMLLGLISVGYLAARKSRLAAKPAAALAA